MDAGIACARLKSVESSTIAKSLNITIRLRALLCAQNTSKSLVGNVDVADSAHSPLAFLLFLEKLLLSSNGLH